MKKINLFKLMYYILYYIHCNSLFIYKTNLNNFFNYYVSKK